MKKGLNFCYCISCSCSLIFSHILSLLSFYPKPNLLVFPSLTIESAIPYHHTPAINAPLIISFLPRNYVSLWQLRFNRFDLFLIIENYALHRWVRIISSDTYLCASDQDRDI